uniref:Fanconi Anaemia group E protein C-terminal domain-containing protein n=1 Tax=Eptatretus burgeri TaxID=7764 RepID=A0A8C4QG64_EPTBU
MPNKWTQNSQEQDFEMMGDFEPHKLITNLAIPRSCRLLLSALCCSIPGALRCARCLQARELARKSSDCADFAGVLKGKGTMGDCFCWEDFVRVLCSEQPVETPVGGRETKKLELLPLLSCFPVWLQRRTLVLLCAIWRLLPTHSLHDLYLALKTHPPQDPWTRVLLACLLCRVRSVNQGCGETSICGEGPEVNSIVCLGKADGDTGAKCNKDVEVEVISEEEHGAVAENVEIDAKVAKGEENIEFAKSERPFETGNEEGHELGKDENDGPMKAIIGDQDNEIKENRVGEERQDMDVTEDWNGRTVVSEISWPRYRSLCQLLVSRSQSGLEALEKRDPERHVREELKTRTPMSENHHDVKIQKKDCRNEEEEEEEERGHLLKRAKISHELHYMVDNRMERKEKTRHNGSIESANEEAKEERMHEKKEGEEEKKTVGGGEIEVQETELPEDVLAGTERIKDWLNDYPNTDPPVELVLFGSCNIQQTLTGVQGCPTRGCTAKRGAGDGRDTHARISGRFRFTDDFLLRAVCRNLSLSDLPLPAMAAFVSALVQVHPAPSHAVILFVAAQVFLQKLRGLHSPPPRSLTCSLVMLTGLFPQAVASAIITPLSAFPLGRFQAELLSKLLKESIPQEELPFLLRQMIIRDREVWGGGLPTILQAIFEQKPDLEAEDLETAIMTMSNRSTELRAYLPFAKLCFAFINKYGSLLSMPQLSVLHRVAEENETLLRHSLTVRLRKLQK